ncbi:MAG: BPSS1780 family membrane protein [Candidatus Sedimenticola sp. (ex Thyasira tokunagai)]
MAPLFKIRFTGRLHPGVNREHVILAFSRRFSISQDKVRQLLARGEGVTLKKGLDHQEAERYWQAVEELGMEVALVPMDALPTTPGMTLEMLDEKPVEVTADPVRSEEGGGLAVKLQQAAEQMSLESTEEIKAEGTESSGTHAEADVCPKCGSDWIDAGSCRACGIIIEKYLAAQARIAEDNSDDAVDDKQSNPYAVPQSDLIPESDLGDFSGPVAQPMGHGWQWISRGYWHFRQNPFAWIGAILAWMLASVVITVIPVIGAIGSLALSLLSPVIFAGFMLGAQDQEQGEDFRLNHLLAGFSSNTKQLLLVGLLYIVGLIVIVVALASLMGGLFMLSGEALSQGTMPPASSIMLAVLAGMALTIPLMMAYWFAPALIALEGMSAVAAMKLSFIGCVKNILPFLLYGVITLIFMIIGSIPVGLGLLVVVPVMFASMYTACRDIYYS